MKPDLSGKSLQIFLFIIRHLLIHSLFYYSAEKLIR